jgi:hypothetical protein
LIEALAAELEAECGQAVLRVSGASGAGTEAVLDAILDHLDTREEQSEAAQADAWSPL